jgi:hypothetical protein
VAQVKVVSLSLILLLVGEVLFCYRTHVDEKITNAAPNRVDIFNRMRHSTALPNFRSGEVKCGWLAFQTLDGGSLSIGIGLVTVRRKVVVDV